ncbi:MAG: UvrD-helicase domain-containing protein [Methanophagales archaeon]|nr:UvrD-helicase domain-containing protein [Methanophagales archaeon]
MGVPFEKLNERQKIAVKASGKRTLILAGPGTGKTEVLGHRIKYLIEEKNADSSKILAVTFTVKAAEEMVNRLKEFSNFDPVGIRVLTIHGEAWRILCQNQLERLSIIDDDEMKMLLQDVIEDLELGNLRIKETKRYVELNKANNKLPEDLRERKEDFLSIYQKYEELMQFNRVIDFGGVLTDVLRLFNDLEILGKYQRNTKYILVDEYQDINQAQFEFIRSLCAEYTELFCVGDDDQSIYGWRGAKPDFILNFKEDYKGSIELPLNESRRCSENILKAALNLISKIPEDKRRSKNIYAYSKGGEPIYILKSSSEIQEALWIANWIKNEITNDRLNPKEIVIICRDIGLAKDVVTELKKRNIPVEYCREGAMFKDPEVKEIFAHLRVIAKPQDNLALRRCLLSKSVRNVGKIRVSYLRNEAQRLNKPIWDILSDYSYSSQRRWEINLFEFVEWINELRNIAKDNSVGILLEEIIKRLNPSEDNKHLEELKKLTQTLTDISLKKFLDKIVIKRKLDITDGDAGLEEEENAIAVMSMHSSKGLTYKVVFILGMEEGNFPKDNSNVEEERRLCYVAMTRAKEKLFLCTAKRRKGRAAQGLSFYDCPSKFLDDIYPCKVNEIKNYPDKTKWE